MNWRLVKKTTKTPFFHYVSYVVIGVPLLAELFNAVHPYFPHTRFPHLLLFGFAAGVMFVFSEVIYHFACPEIIERYETEKQYVDTHEKEYAAALAHQRLEVVLTHLEPSEEDIRANLQAIKRRNDVTELNKNLDVLYPIAVVRYLRKNYRSQAHSMRAAAWIAFSLFVIGFVLALFVMYGRIEAVWEASKG